MELYMKKIIIILSSLSLAVLLGSCVSPIGLTSSSTPLQGKIIEENLGASEGGHGSVAVLGLYSIGRPDIDIAIDEAVKKKGGDALINVRLYESTSYFVLFSYTKVIVKGEVIRFSSAPQKGKGR
jgi:hypothetical protein